MELKITSRNIDLPPQAHQHIERKLGKMGRQLPGLSDVKVEIAEQDTKRPEDRFVAQVTTVFNGTTLRGEERGGNLLTAIDRVADVIQNQLTHFKGKLYDRGRGETALKKSESATANKEDIAKVKHFRLKPMTADDAIEQMELLGHDFFLFINQKTGEFNVLYRRRSSGYGIIEAKGE